MKITILYLYYDILNLYGESGNVKALKKYLESLQVDVHIKFSTLNDEINLKDVDMIYIGMGSDNNQLLALKHLKKYKKEIKEFILNGKFVLATGNAMELFGHSIDHEPALNIFSYSTKKETYRIVDEALYKTNFISSYMIGFNNRNIFYGIFYLFFKKIFKSKVASGFKRGDFNFNIFHYNLVSDCNVNHFQNYFH